MEVTLTIEPEIIGTDTWYRAVLRNGKDGKYTCEGIEPTVRAAIRKVYLHMTALPQESRTDWIHEGIRMLANALQA